MKAVPSRCVKLVFTHSPFFSFLLPPPLPSFLFSAPSSTLKPLHLFMACVLLDAQICPVVIIVFLAPAHPSQIVSLFPDPYLDKRVNSFPPFVLSLFFTLLPPPPPPPLSHAVTQVHDPFFEFSSSLPHPPCLVQRSKLCLRSTRDLHQHHLHCPAMHPLEPSRQLPSCPFWITRLLLPPLSPVGVEEGVRDGEGEEEGGAEKGRGRAVTVMDCAAGSQSAWRSWGRYDWLAELGRVLLLGRVRESWTVKCTVCRLQLARMHSWIQT